jgi:hypothetical protein
MDDTMRLTAEVHAEQAARRILYHWEPANDEDRRSIYEQLRSMIFYHMARLTLALERQNPKDIEAPNYEEEST